MNIEDIIDNLVGWRSFMNPHRIDFSATVSKYDINLLQSFNEQIDRNLGFTEKQRTTALHILKRNADQFSKVVPTLLDHIENPKFKLAIRVIPKTKTVTIEQANERVKLIKVSFPYIEDIVNSIKEYQKKVSSARAALGASFTSPQSINWNHDTRTWDFGLEEPHIMWIVNNLLPQGFEADDEFNKYAQAISDVIENAERYVPMLEFNGEFKFKNTHRNIPMPSKSDFIEAMIESKKYGISTWDDNIETMLSAPNINPCTRDFFRNTKSQFEQANTYKFQDLEQIVTRLGTVVFVIPGGSELISLKAAHDFLKNAGVPNEEITVLFRLDSNAGKICNDYVKENKLNNPVSDTTKYIFISIKVPKPLLANKKSIDAIVNMGSNSAHYTVKNLLRQHHCVINYSVNTSKR